MSLRNQILYRILLSAAGILLVGGSLTIWQARNAVEKEIDSSIHLALQFISLGIADSPVYQFNDLHNFAKLQPTRHLSIQLQKPDGQLLHLKATDQPSHPEAMPPRWFIHAVQSDYPQVEHQIKTRDGELLTLIIKAQPLDEITEVWQESVTWFSSISLLILLTFFAVNLVFNKSLRSINVIVDALHQIETGHYCSPLPGFAVQEFDQIAGAINHLSDQLQRAQQQNQALTQHSLAIQEAERQTLSQELHDEFGQSLTTIKIMASTATSPKADLNLLASTIPAICEHLMLVLRSMMQQLHPLILSELGLKATLEDMVSCWQKRHPNLTIALDCDESIDSLDQAISIQIFRVIQECLTNSVRHADASVISITLNQSAKTLKLRISDDGQGCDLSSVARGFGLLGIRERIQSLQGNLSISSSPGQGMTINATVPLS